MYWEFLNPLLLRVLSLLVLFLNLLIVPVAFMLATVITTFAVFGMITKTLSQPFYRVREYLQKRM
jgi:uncharacterized membrane protein AbrB (regulator of aidB expression)